MPTAMETLVEGLREARDRIEAEIADRRAAFRYRVERRRVIFEDEMRARHRAMRESLRSFLGRTRPLTVLTAPLIYAMIVPFALMDACVTLYQAICFRAYGIDRARRGRLHLSGSPSTRLPERSAKAELRLLRLCQRRCGLYPRGGGPHRSLLVPDQAFQASAGPARSLSGVSGLWRCGGVSGPYRGRYPPSQARRSALRSARESVVLFYPFGRRVLRTPLRGAWTPGGRVPPEARPVATNSLSAACPARGTRGVAREVARGKGRCVGMGAGRLGCAHPGDMGRLTKCGRWINRGAKCDGVWTGVAIAKIFEWYPEISTPEVARTARSCGFAGRCRNRWKDLRRIEGSILSIPRWPSSSHLDDFQAR